MARFKRIVAQIFGPILLVLGCLLLLTTISAFWSRHLHAFPALDWFIYIGLICFFIWGGIRAVRMGFGNEAIPVARTTVWKLTLGFLLITIEIKNRVQPSPNRLTAANEGEAVGMLMAEIFFYALGIWLIVSGIRAKYKNVTILVNQGP